MSSEDIKAVGRSLRQIEDPVSRRLFEAILSNIDKITVSLDALENPEPYKWFDAELENGWVQYSADNNLPQYTKTYDGLVKIRGTISGGTPAPGTVLFTLPAGYRPYRDVIHATISNVSLGRVDISPDGSVMLMIGSNVLVALDGIEFQGYR